MIDPIDNLDGEVGRDCRFNASQWETEKKSTSVVRTRLNDTCDPRSLPMQESTGRARFTGEFRITMSELSAVESMEEVPARISVPSDGADVTVGRLIQFLLGSRVAIATFASRRDTLWLGLVFVISAGLIREYHQGSWIQKPWLIATPLIWATVFTLLLFPLVTIVARQRGAIVENYWARCRVFLGLVWMTAPLAWVFILPVDQLMPAEDAAIIKLWFLGIVAIWRIYLVTRILATLFVPHSSEVIFTGTFFILMLVVDTIFLCNFGGGRPVLMVGSTSETPVAEFVVLHLLTVMSFIGVMTWPIWLIGTLMVALGQGPRWAWTVRPAVSSGPLSTGIKVLAAASLLICLVLWPFAKVNP